MCGSCSSSSPAVEGLLLGHPSITLCSLDETVHSLITAWIARRSWQKQVPAHSGKRPFTPAAHHAQSIGETTSLSQGGSNAPRLAGKVGSHMAAGPFHWSTRHTAAVASGALSPGLETQVKGRFPRAEDRCRNHRFDQGDGSEKSTVGC